MRKNIILSAHRGWAKSKIAKHLEDTYGLNTRFSHWLVSHAMPKVLANPAAKKNHPALFSIEEKNGKQWEVIDSYHTYPVAKEELKACKESNPKRKYRISRKDVMLDNPVRQKVVKIYDNILQIKARKGEDSLWPGELFVHDFSEKSKAAIYGLENGDILIHSHSGKKLHKKFNYPSRSRG